MTSTSLLPARGGLRMTPARRVTLAFGVPVILAVIGWIGFNTITLFGQASFQVSLAVPQSGGQLNLNLNGDNITVARGSAIRLTGTVTYTLTRPSVTEQDDGGVTNVNLGCAMSIGNCGLVTNLEVTPRTPTTISTGGGDLSISGLDAPVAVTAEGGNVTASDLSGKVNVNTGGGDLSASGLSGTVDVTAQGGNITANGLSGNLNLDSGGGDLNGSGLTGRAAIATAGGNIGETGVDVPDLTADSGGGDVTLTFTQPPGNVQISAEGGNVTVILPPGNTKYDISTPNFYGGNVSYPGSLASSSSGHKLTIDSGGGDVTVTQG